MPDLLQLSTDELLSTTRAVRKRLDFERPVSREVLMECLELALQAPSGSNAQNWHFMLVTNPEKRRKIADLYRQAFADYVNGPMAPTQHNGDASYAHTQERVLQSAQYLADNLHQAPAFLIPCHLGRIDGLSGPGANLANASVFGSVLPALWSFMLAARSRGLGTCWTTLHLVKEEACAAILDIPFTEVTQMALVPIAYTRGTDFKPGPRKASQQIVHFDSW